MSRLALVIMMAIWIVTITSTTGQVTFSKGSWSPNGKRSKSAMPSSQHRKMADHSGSSSKQMTLAKKLHYEAYESPSISLFAQLLAKQLNTLMDDIPSNQRKEFMVSFRTKK